MATIATTAEKIHPETLPSVPGEFLVSDLTRRQRELLDVLVDGLENAEIAARLHISTLTVKEHVKNILNRTGARNRVALAVWWASIQAARRSDLDVPFAIVRWELVPLVSPFAEDVAPAVEGRVAG